MEPDIGIALTAEEPDLSRRSITAIEENLAGKPKALAMWNQISDDDEIREIWNMADFIATKKLGMNDHGRTHAQVATASALTMLNLLEESFIDPDFVIAGFGDPDDAALIVLVATLFHDFGNMVHRTDHADISVGVAQPVIDRLLAGMYPDPVYRTRIRSFILSGIYTHHGEPRPLTIESALVCIGDSTDMTKGRGRAAFERGSISIHSVSALSIVRVEIRKGAQKPLELHITMSNSAGIYQVQEILAPKVRAGPLAEHVDVIAVTSTSQVGEEQIVEGIRMAGSKFVPFRDNEQ